MYASPPQYSHARSCKLIFDLLTLKVVSESRVTWTTCVLILVFLGLSVLELFPMYATDRQASYVTQSTQTDVRQKHRLMSPPIRGGARGGIITLMNPYDIYPVHSFIVVIGIEESRNYDCDHILLFFALWKIFITLRQSLMISRDKQEVNICHVPRS